MDFGLILGFGFGQRFGSSLGLVGFSLFWVCLGFRFGLCLWIFYWILEILRFVFCWVLLLRFEIGLSLHSNFEFSSSSFFFWFEFCFYVWVLVLILV